MKKWLSCHECVNRALRTFLQTAVGVVVAAIIDAAGIISDVNIKAVIVLAVATGLAAAMNLGNIKALEQEAQGDTQNTASSSAGTETTDDTDKSS